MQRKSHGITVCRIADILSSVIILWCSLMVYNIHSGNGKALQKINICFLDQNLLDAKLVSIQTLSHKG